MKFTQQGRVVYDRPKHYFEVKDVKRILEKMDFGAAQANLGGVSEVFEVYLLSGRLMLRAFAATKFILKPGELSAMLVAVARNFLEIAKILADIVPTAILDIMEEIYKTFLSPWRD